VAATNEDVYNATDNEESRYRQDLFQRFTDVHRIPPLRDMKNNLDYLVDIMLQNESINIDRRIETGGKPTPQAWHGFARFWLLVSPRFTSILRCSNAVRLLRPGFCFLGRCLPISQFLAMHDAIALRSAQSDPVTPDASKFLAKYF
jgi:hypothetical protein